MNSWVFLTAKSRPTFQNRSKGDINQLTKRQDPLPQVETPDAPVVHAIHYPETSSLWIDHGERPSHTLVKKAAIWPQAHPPLVHHKGFPPQTLNFLRILMRTISHLLFSRRIATNNKVKPRTT